jgi:hypothetical protein
VLEAGGAEVFVVNPDGTDAVNLTDNAGGDRHPSWEPRGKRTDVTVLLGLLNLLPRGSVIPCSGASPRPAPRLAFGVGLTALEPSCRRLLLSCCSLRSRAPFR